MRLGLLNFDFFAELKLVTSLTITGLISFIRILLSVEFDAG